MGSSSSAPVRQVLSEDEGIALINNDIQTGQDTLNVPEVESNYPRVEPPVDTEKNCLGRSVITTDMTPSQRSIASSNVVFEELQKVGVSKVIPKASNENEGNNNETKTTITVPALRLAKETPTINRNTGTKQGISQPSLQQNTSTEGLTSTPRSYKYKTSMSQEGSLALSSVISEQDLKIDPQNFKSLKQREVMLIQRERYEYQLLASQASLPPERSPRVQIPSKLSQAWDALQNPDQTNASSTIQYLDYSEADKKATEHKDHRADTYASLVGDLTSSLDNDALKVWSILSWISKQQIGRISFGDKMFSQDTPNGYIQMIQQNKGTYPVLFALMCRSAGIPCAVVNGLSKSSNYEVGSNDIDDLRSTWNAVFVEGAWRLVHPLWVCRSLCGHQQGGWRTIERDGMSSNNPHREEIGKEVATYNSYYIFTNPGEFIYRNFPDEPRWQLLQDSWSKEEFINRAFLRPEFFKRNLKLLSDDKCVLISENGRPCVIEIGHSAKETNDLIFTYDLCIKSEEHTDENGVLLEDQNNNGMKGATNTKTSSEFVDRNNADRNSIVKNFDHSAETDLTQRVNIGDLNDNVVNGFDTLHGKHLIKDSVQKETKIHKFVVVSKAHDLVTFEIRFQKKGTYRLRIYGGLFSIHGSDPPCIMHVRLNCLADVVQPTPIPFDPGIVGWGPGPIAESLGLYVPSHVCGTITVTSDEETVLQFILKRKIQVQVEMVHAEIEEEILSRFLHYQVVELRDTIELRVVILCPGKGEYAVKIDALNGKTKRMENACNYLVHTQKERPHEYYYARKARRMVLEAMLEDNLSALEEAVESCKQFGPTEDDPEIRGSLNRLEYLQCRKGLKESLLVSRIDVSEHAIYRAKSSQYSTLLSRDIRKAERHLDDISELNKGGWHCHLPEINRQSLFEMCRLRKPKEEIHLTMKAVLLLVGVENSDLESWSQIQLLLRKGDDTLIEMARLEKFLEIEQFPSVDDETLEKVQEIVNTHSEEDVRRIDNTAASFYQWAFNILATLKRLHKQKTPKTPKEEMRARKKTT